MPEGFLLLLAELPDEGVWCSAHGATYERTARRVEELWGPDFRPVFKYRVPAGPTSRGPLAVITCEDDFELWLRGGTAATGGAVAPLTRKLYAHRQTCLPPAGVPDGAHACRPCAPVTSLLDGSGAVATVPSGGWPSNAELSAHPYFNTVQCGVFRPRSSPAVQLACQQQQREDGRQRLCGSPAPPDALPPLSTRLPPTLVHRLGVRAVLQHSCADEVVLAAAHAHCTVPPPGSAASGRARVAGDGYVLWSELVARARNAWGVHRPFFVYAAPLSLGCGYTRVLITDAKGFCFWLKEVGHVNPQLLVQEGALLLHGPAAVPTTAAERTAAESARRYVAAQPPRELHVASALHRAVHLSSMAARLAELEEEQRQAALSRRARSCGSGSATAGNLRHGLSDDASPRATHSAPTVTACQEALECHQRPSTARASRGETTSLAACGSADALPEEQLAPPECGGASAHTVGPCPPTCTDARDAAWTARGLAASSEEDAEPFRRALEGLPALLRSSSSTRTTATATPFLTTSVVAGEQRGGSDTGLGGSAARARGSTSQQTSSRPSALFWGEAAYVRTRIAAGEFGSVLTVAGALSAPTR